MCDDDTTSVVFSHLIIPIKVKGMVRGKDRRVELGYSLALQYRRSILYRVFFNWYPPKKYGKPRLGESTLTKIILDTPNLA